jgi:hypothetical protein
VTGDRRGTACPNEELAVGWAMHALEPNEEAFLRDHVSSCTRCQRTVGSTHEVMAVMGGSFRQEDPPPRLRARLMDAIEHTPQEQASGPGGPKHALAEPIQLRPRRRGRSFLVAAAILAVVGLGGLAGVRLAQMSSEINAAQSQNQQLSRALAVTADPTASRAPLRSSTGSSVGTLVSTDSDAVFVPQNLTRNDSSHIYVVWGTSTPAPEPLATFDMSDGPRLLAWSADAHKHKGFAISIEPGRVAPPEPSTVVASGQVA